jgi:hypothetical protein
VYLWWWARRVNLIKKYKVFNMDISKSFYDNFATKLLSDYIYGNPRAEAAIKYALRWIPRGSRKILDIGC